MAHADARLSCFVPDRHRHRYVLWSRIADRLASPCVPQPPFRLPSRIPFVDPSADVRLFPARETTLLGTPPSLSSSTLDRLPPLRTRPSISLLELAPISPSSTVSLIFSSRTMLVSIRRYVFFPLSPPLFASSASLLPFRDPMAHSSLFPSSTSFLFVFDSSSRSTLSASTSSRTSSRSTTPKRWRRSRASPNRPSETRPRSSESARGCSRPLFRVSTSRTRLLRRLAWLTGST
jgi:hypothetical protein